MTNLTQNTAPTLTSVIDEMIGLLQKTSAAALASDIAHLNRFILSNLKYDHLYCVLSQCIDEYLADELLHIIDTELPNINTTEFEQFVDTSGATQVIELIQTRLDL